MKNEECTLFYHYRNICLLKILYKIYRTDEYGSIRVFFIEKIRDEVKFNNLEVLKEQLLHDRNCAKEFFDKHPLAEL